MESELIGNMRLKIISTRPNINRSNATILKLYKRLDHYMTLSKFHGCVCVLKI